MPPLRFVLHASSLLSTVLVACSALTGCLEANPAAPDGGVADATHTSTGSTGPATSSNGTTGATTGAGATSATGATSGAMTTGSLDAGAPLDGDLIPSCKDASTLNNACAACDESKCSSEVVAAVSACAAFYTCYEMCSCGDSTCIMACEKAAPSSCATPATNLINCESAMCASACGLDAGMTTSKDSGPPPADAGATCKNPTSTQEKCGECETTSCASTVASEKSTCGTFNTCFDACDCSDTTCQDQCYEAASSACQAVLGDLQTCQTSTCKSACTASADAGAPSGDGGSSGDTVPDCKDPTSEEQTFYTQCSTCDNTNCAPDVTNAVSSCSAYYSCIASTDCSTALEACEPQMESSGCETAVDELTACQNDFCYFACTP